MSGIYSHKEWFALLSAAREALRRGDYLTAEQRIAVELTLHALAAGPGARGSAQRAEFDYTIKMARDPLSGHGNVGRRLLKVIKAHELAHTQPEPYEDPSDAMRRYRARKATGVKAKVGRPKKSRP